MVLCCNVLYKWLVFLKFTLMKLANRLPQVGKITEYEHECAAHFLLNEYG